MIELKSIPKNDSDLVWIIWLYLGTQIIKLSTKEMTLSGNAYCFESIGFNSINLTGSALTIDSNHIGSLAQISFNICKYNDLPEPFASAEFQNYFAPYTTVNLTSSIIDFGFCTKDSTNENQINWLNRFSVESYEYVENGINITANEFIEFEQLLLPSDVTQNNEPDNFVTYVTFKESAGFPIPITYGRFYQYASYPDNRIDLVNSYYNLAPLILVDPLEMKFLASNSKIGLISNVFVLDQSGYYLKVYNRDVSHELYYSTSISTTTMYPNSGGRIAFDFYVPLNFLGEVQPSPVTLRNDVGNLDDIDLDNYVELDPSGGVDYIFLTGSGSLSAEITKAGRRYDNESSMIIGYETLDDNAEITIFNKDYDPGLGQLGFLIPTAGKGEFSFPLRNFNDDDPLPFYDLPGNSASDYYIGNRITDPQKTQKFRLRYALLFFSKVTFMGNAPKVIIRKATYANKANLIGRNDTSMIKIEHKI